MGPILLSKRRPLGIMIKRPKGRASLPQELSAIGHHLVFAEGTKTELSYAKSIEKAILSKYLVDPEVSHVEIIEVDHRKKALDTIRLLDYAEQEITQRISQGERIDYVWVFFDKDDYHFADFQSAIARIERKNKSEYQERNLNNDPCDKNGIHWTACFSNRCFELWPCLYFCYFQSTVSACDDYIEQINQFLKKANPDCRYEKTSEGLHQTLVSAKGSLDNAIRYGRKLRQKNGINEPSTGISDFAYYFKNYLRTDEEEKEGEHHGIIR